MFTRTKKKIITLSTITITFFKNNLAQIVFLIFLFQLIFSARTLPYINLIPNYIYYSIAFLLFLTMIFFRVVISNRRVIQITLCLFVIALVAAIIGTADISDLLGFIIYILFLFIIIRQILNERKSLQGKIE